MKLRIGLSVIALALVVGTAAGQSPPTKLSGDIVSVNGASLQLRKVSGETVEIRLSDQTRLSARSPTDRAAIREGVYLGTTAAPQTDGALIASEVHIFSEAMRGTSEGHRPMPNDPVNTMTNATVANVSAEKAPAAAKVAAVEGSAGTLRMALRYKGGEKIVIVPDNIPVVLIEMGDRGMLVPGAHVVVYGSQASGGSALLAERISIGKNGYAPLQ